MAWPNNAGFLEEPQSGHPQWTEARRAGQSPLPSDPCTRRRAGASQGMGKGQGAGACRTGTMLTTQDCVDSVTHNMPFIVYFLGSDSASKVGCLGQDE